MDPLTEQMSSETSAKAWKELVLHSTLAILNDFWKTTVDAKQCSPDLARKFGQGIVRVCDM